MSVPVVGPVDAGYLRGGPQGALTVALVALHLRGAVDSGRPGTMRVSGRADGVTEPLQAAAYAALHRPAGIRFLAGRRPVRAALDSVRDRLAGQALLRRGPLRRLLPARTRAGSRALAELRGRFPLPAGLGPGVVRREGWSQEDIVMAVALYGTPALLATVPHFARDGGLLGRGGSDDGTGFSRGGQDGGISGTAYDSGAV